MRSRARFESKSCFQVEFFTLYSHFGVAYGKELSQEEKNETYFLEQCRQDFQFVFTDLSEYEDEYKNTFPD